MPDLCLIVSFTLLFAFIRIIFRPMCCAGIFYGKLSKPDELWVNSSQKFMNLKR